MFSYVSNFCCGLFNKEDSASLPKSILQGTCKNIIKIAGALFAEFALLVPISLASGNFGTLLAGFKVIDCKTAPSLNTRGLDLSTSRIWIVEIASFLNTFANMLRRPYIKGLSYLCPEIHYKGRQLTKLFISTSSEDMVFIGLIQRKALPMLSKIFPKPIENVLNHKVTRVVLTSTIFALCHKNNLAHPIGIMPQFVGGIFYGAIAELDDSLVVPIATHFLYNLILGAGRRI